MDEKDKPLLKPKVIAVPETPSKDGRTKKFMTVFFGAILALAILAVGATCVMKYKEMDDFIVSQKIGLHDKTENIKALTEQLYTVTKTASDLKEKLANLKNKEDLAKRDLEMYILKKYRVIPEVVAHEMAVQTVKLTKEHAVPFSLIVGLMEVESQFKPWAISKKDARGPMQVMPFWVKKKKSINLEISSKYDLHDVSTGITAGIRVFKYHLKEAKNDINQGLYLYVGKDRTYANKVFNAMGRFEIFRSTLDTTMRDEEIKEVVGIKAEAIIQ